MKSTASVDRRTFLVTALAGIVRAGFVEGQNQITRPVVSESDCPLEVMAPVATDGYRGQAVLRKPPGRGPFPAFITLHGGITTVPLSRLESIARDLANPSRFLAAGYVVVAPTYRSRDVDLQSPVSLEDSLAVVDYVRKLPYVDARSIVVYGCSGEETWHWRLRPGRGFARWSRRNPQAR
jgi:acetyl esterase/lipase